MDPKTALCCKASILALAFLTGSDLSRRDIFLKAVLSTPIFNKCVQNGAAGVGVPLAVMSTQKLHFAAKVLFGLSLQVQTFWNVKVTFGYQVFRHRDELSRVVRSVVKAFVDTSLFNLATPF